MKSFIIAAFLAVVGTAAAINGVGGLGGAGGHHLYQQHHHQDYYAYPKYSYNYGVADKLTGDQKSAGEVRDGEYTKGYYQLVQPDGVLRTVHYTVHPKAGFQAQVINKGKALHPALYKGYGYGGGLGNGIGSLGNGIGLGGRGGGLGGGSLGGRGGGLGLGGGLGGPGLGGYGGIDVIG